MNAANSQRLLQHIRRLVADPRSTPSDGELIRRYLECGDPSAFATLMQRHGAMVFAVCQSVLRQRDDAEDALQAAFLILAQKAGSIRRQEGLGGWLQRVAYHVALKARANKVRRQKREADAVAGRASVSACEDLSWGEVRTILHAELAALPESFRAPLVLCYLEGLTQEEAAQQLGWTAATVKGRLQRGREKLRRRLERRGVGLASALAAALTGQALADTAVRMSGPLTMETATPTAAALAREFVRPFLSMKLAVLSVVLLSFGVIAGSVVLRAPQPQREAVPAAVGDKPAEKRPQPRAAVDAHGDPLPEDAVARLGTIRFNHGQGLRHLLFSPDGKTIYSEGGGSLRVWDAATGVERGHLASIQRSHDNLVLTPDGKRMVSLNQDFNGDNDDVVRVWDLSRIKEIRKLPLPVKRSEWSISRRNALSPDGRLGAVNLPTEMRIFDLTTGRELYKLAKGGKDVRDVVFAGNERIVTADTKKTIDVWEARTGKLVRRFDHGGPAEVLATSPDGRWLATLEHHTYAIDRMLDKDVVHVWNLSAAVKKHTLAARPKRWFMSVYFSPDGKRLLASSQGQERSELTIWDMETGERVREMGDAYGMVLAVSADGSQLATGNQPGKFELWDMKTGGRLSSEDSRYARAAALAFSPTDENIVLLGFSSLSTWETTTGRRKSSFDFPSRTSFPPFPALSSDGRYALSFTGGWEKYQTLIWDVAQRRRLCSLEAPCWMGAFSLNSSLLAIWETGKEPVIRLRDVATGREVRTFAGGNANWPFLSFTSDGKTLVAANEKIVGYDISSGKELFSWRMKPLSDHSGGDRAVGVNSEGQNNPRAWRGFTASPDGTRIAVTLAGGDNDFRRQPLRNRIALFDARTGKLLRRWSDSGTPSSSWEKLSFSYDGQLLASSDGKVIHLWETATGKKIRTSRGHRGEIEFLAFSHDDRRLASTSWDSTVLLWDVTGSSVRLTTDAALEESWKALAGDDAGHAQRAVWALALTPDKSIPLLKDRLRPAKGVNREHLDRLMKDLDGNQFALREKAATELENLGELAEPALRRILENKPTLEQRRRIEPILANLDAATPSGEALRSLRAVRVLEHAGTPEARRLLRELAGGAEDAQLTRETKAVLTRLSRHSP